MTDLIQLQHCNVNQSTQDGVKSDWEVRENITGDVLFTMPANLPDNVIWDLIHAMRKYELKALNAGIEFQKENQSSMLHSENELLKRQLTEVTTHSNRLAERVEAFTNGEA